MKPWLCLVLGGLPSVWALIHQASLAHSVEPQEGDICRARASILAVSPFLMDYNHASSHLTHFLAVLLAIFEACIAVYLMSSRDLRVLPVSLALPTFLGSVWSPLCFLTIAKVFVGSQVPTYFMAASLPFFRLHLAMVPGLVRLGVSLPSLHLEPQWLLVIPR